MSKKKRKASGAKQPLQKATIVIPSNISKEILMVIHNELQKISTRCQMYKAPDGTKTRIEVWYTNRQSYYIDRFNRSVLRGKRYDEGYDISELKRYQDEITKDAYDDPFILPQDNDRLNIQAAATGMQSAFLDSPAYRDKDELQQISKKICDLFDELWREGTNDHVAYRELFIPAFLAGYQIGIQQLAYASPQERRAATERVLDQEVKGNGAYVIKWFADRISARMKDVNVNNIYSLIQE